MAKKVSLVRLYLKNFTGKNVNVSAKKSKKRAKVRDLVTELRLYRKRRILKGHADESVKLAHSIATRKIKEIEKKKTKQKKLRKELAEMLVLKKRRNSIETNNNNKKNNKKKRTRRTKR